MNRRRRLQDGAISKAWPGPPPEAGRRKGTSLKAATLPHTMQRQLPTAILPPFSACHTCCRQLKREGVKRQTAFFSSRPGRLERQTSK